MLVAPKPELGKRSPHWPTVRAAHLAMHPTCAACGGTEHLEVHHIQVYHLNPTLELDPTNLITLCESSHACHYTYGHLYSWHSWNELVIHDAALWLYKVRHRPLAA